MKRDLLIDDLSNCPHENPYRNASSAWALGQGIKFPTLGTNKTPPSGLRPSGWYFVCPRAGNFIPALAPMRKSDILSQKIMENRIQVYHEERLSQLCPCGSEISKELRKITMEMTEAIETISESQNFSSLQPLNLSVRK